MARESNWRSIVIQADPEWPRNSRIVPEYEFTGPGPKASSLGGLRESDNGKTVFLRDYTQSAIYSTDWDTS